MTNLVRSPIPKIVSDSIYRLSFSIICVHFDTSCLTSFTIVITGWCSSVSCVVSVNGMYDSLAVSCVPSCNMYNVSIIEKCTLKQGHSMNICSIVLNKWSKLFWNIKHEFNLIIEDGSQIGNAKPASICISRVHTLHMVTLCMSV